MQTISQRHELRNILCISLKQAESSIRSLRVPGVHQGLSGAVQVLEAAGLQKADITIFNELLERTMDFRLSILQILSVIGSSTPEPLQRDLQNFASEVQKIVEPCLQSATQLNKKGPLGRSLLAKQHTEALNLFGTKLTKAMEAFMVKAVVNMTLANRIREDERLMKKLAEGVERDSSYMAKPAFPTEFDDIVPPAALMDEIIQWTRDSDPAHGRVLWLYSEAGTGKTSFVKTLARRFKDENTPRAIFMFSELDGVTDGGKVIPTWAYQLASDLPGFKADLLKAIRHSEMSIRGDIHAQFDNLLASPLSRLLPPHPHTVLILDGLEDCTPYSLVSVLSLIIDSTRKFPFLRILITSRPDTPVRFQFEDHVRDLTIPTSTEDVKTYVRARLTRAHRRFDPKAQTQWPSDDCLASFVVHAGSLFITAATAVRFIDSDQSNQADQLQHRLDMILSDDDIVEETGTFGHEGSQTRKSVSDSLLDPTSGDDDAFREPINTSLSHLHRLYRKIIQEAFLQGKEGFVTRFQSVVGTIVFSLARPLTIGSLTEILGPEYNSDKIRATLHDLRSVILVPSKADMAGIRVYHKTFAAFVADPCRCTLDGALLRPTTHHARLYSRHLHLLEEAIQNDPSDGETIQLRVTAATHRLQLCVLHLSAFRDHITEYYPATEEIERIQLEAERVSGVFKGYDVRTKNLRIPGQTSPRYPNPSQDPAGFGYSRLLWEDLLAALSQGCD